MINKFAYYETGICPQLRPPYKGRLHANKVRFLDGEEVTFSCENNHDLFGKARLRCVGKKWDSSVPECKGEFVLESSLLVVTVKYDHTGKLSICNCSSCMEKRQCLTRNWRYTN